MLERPSSPPSETPNADAQIEDYLDKVCAPLIGGLPYAARQELRREIRSHLRSLIAAFIETGTAPQDALSMALKKFGDPAFVAAQWRPELRRARPVNWLHSQRQGIAATLAAGAIVTLVLLTTLPGNEAAHNTSGARPNVARITPEPAFQGRRSFRHADAVNRGMACRDCHRSDVNLSPQRGFVFISDRNGNLWRTSGNYIRVISPNKIRLSVPVERAQRNGR